MTFSEKRIDIQITEKAALFIKSKRLMEPLILVNLCSRTDSGEGCSGGGCGGGGCDGENTGPAVPFINVIMVDGGKPGDDFIKVDTAAGIPVYMAKSVYNMAQRSKNPITVTVKGLVLKRLSLEGLDLAPRAGESSQEKKNCH